MQLTYNLTEVSKILADFHTITKFRIGIFDANFKELLSYPSQLSSFCRELRQNTTLNTTCMHCDFGAFWECKLKEEPITYECHAGLTEIIVPIKSENGIIGYVMAGQVLSDSSTYNEWHKLLAYIKDYPLDFITLQSTYNTRSKVHTSTISATAHMLEICAHYLYETHILSPDKNSLSYQIDHYIITHIKEPLDVSLLCQVFGYKKTYFHQLTTRLYGTSIMKHVCRLRIQCAKDLLSNSQLSISEIASAVGIPDYNYFTKVFKQVAHCTPREYRRLNPIIPQ